MEKTTKPALNLTYPILALQAIVALYALKVITNETVFSVSRFLFTSATLLLLVFMILAALMTTLVRFKGKLPPQMNVVIDKKKNLMALVYFLIDCAFIGIAVTSEFKSGLMFVCILLVIKNIASAVFLINSRAIAAKFGRA